MRLALIGPFPPYRGGIAQFTKLLSDAFESAGDSVERITYKRLYPSFLFPGKSQVDCDSPFSDDPTPLIDSLLPVRWASTRKYLRSLDLDGILVQWWHPFFAPALRGSLPPEISCAAICHNVLPHESFPLARSLLRGFLKRMKLIVTHSRSDGEAALGVLGELNILKLYLPLYEQYTNGGKSRDFVRNELGYGSEDNVILFFGLVRPYKGLMDLLHAAKELPRTVKLLVVGECYSDRDALTREMSGTELQERVKWIDRFVPDSEVAGYFRASDVVALPYRHATQSAVAQIALAFRKPLVLTRTGGLSEVIDEGETGFLVPPCDPVALADGIRKALVLGGTAGIEQRITRKAAEFSWKNYVSQIRKCWP